jgi:hypothetical protein
VPFTLSHPAAVLPLAGRRLGGWTLALPPLVAGSMAPDLPYYTPFPGWLYGWTHSMAGTFTVDVLFAVVLLGPGHLVARPVAELVAVDRPRPRHLLASWTSTAWPSRRTPAGFVAWYATLVVGTVSHVGWDAFTHPDGQVVTRVAALRGVWAGRHVYTWLQLASSVVGGAVVLGALWLAVRRDTAGTVREPGRQRRPRLAVAALALLGAGVVGAVAKSTTSVAAAARHQPRPYWSLFDLLTGFGAGVAVAVVAYAVVVRLRERRSS